MFGLVSAKEGGRGVAVGNGVGWGVECFFSLISVCFRTEEDQLFRLVVK